MRGRVDEWQRLLGHVERRESIDGGLRATFGPATPLAELARLAVAEAPQPKKPDKTATANQRTNRAQVVAVAGRRERIIGSSRIFKA